MAVSLTVVGVLAVLAGAGYRDFAQWSEYQQAQAQTELARQSLRQFALRHQRLPCPDLSTLGEHAREGNGVDGGCPRHAQIGWLPYETLGLPKPRRGQHLRYAVARPAGADLVAPTGIRAEGSDLDGVARLRRSLTAFAQRAPSADVPYFSDPDPAREDCGRVVGNPAFALVAGLRDRDGDGTGPADALARFDGLNHAMASGNTLCIAAPGRPMDAHYDDIVASEGASALLGWLAAQTR